MKDVPAALPAGFLIAAALERGDARDAFVSVDHESVGSLPAGARVGTSSLRRQCQLRHARPDLELVALRGNVDTRIAKLDAGGCDAIVLATAGLERLGLASRIRARLEPREMLPAVGQGIVGIECLAERREVLSLAQALEHRPTRLALDAERSLAATLGASCSSPIAGFATVDGDTLRLRGLVGAADGSRILADASAGAARDAAALGAALAKTLLDAGAGALL
jgi:hydroxymethylbilane synthase